MQLTQDQVNERLKNKGFLGLDVPKDLDLFTEIKDLKKDKSPFPPIPPSLSSTYIIHIWDV